METNIREYIKSLNCRLLFAEKITFSKVDTYHKLYHNNDFVSYIQNSQIPYDNINLYIQHLKQKVTTCIICITNINKKLIDIILNQFILLKFNIILVCQNYDYIKFAIDN